MRLVTLDAVHTHTHTPVQLENRKNKIGIDTRVLCQNADRHN